ncbi:DUF2268 domain-containing putative Zn-dependent protease [Robiginitalea sp. IMCC44478]|uniref:DUF2268 domain-containing putative Zn-dependent protease n=1 Tax=Robiginitalea sp. IMCC44478 TaxID=3459122 RepID=UPI00404390DB
MKKLLRSLLLIIPVSWIFSCNPDSKHTTTANVEVIFQEDSLKFSTQKKAFIQKAVSHAEKEVRELIPNLPDSIRVIIEQVDWNLDLVDGVTGRTERNSPPLVLIQVSNNFQGGIADSLATGLRSTIFHEFHHLYRGWAIQDNKFGPGIPNAMVNEGLAVVFSEVYTGDINTVNAYTDETDTWVKEILDLPLNASYSDWVMGEHPDGRTYIGYRAGNYLIRRAMEKSGKNVLELSKLAPGEILNLAGYKDLR